jgi:thioester reductase-like protein
MARKSRRTASGSRGVTLVTGLPQFTTRRLVAELAGADPAARLALLVPERAMPAAQRLVASLPGDPDRFQVLEGDVRKMDLGLSGPELNALAREVRIIHHMASVFHLGVDRSVAEDVNVGGTMEVLELARIAGGLERLVYYSTVGVSGDYRGVWTEDDLDRGQRFANHYEETKLRMEKLLRGVPGLPLTVIRSPVIVGDSATGEIDRFDGPYQLMLLFIALPVDLGLPLPGRASRYINLVPVDHFARAARVLSSHPDATGHTYHVVDPDPLTMARVFELVATASEKKVPRGYIPAPLTRAVMRTPGLERFADSPVAALDLFTADVVYASSGAQALLREAGVRCPRFPDYVDNLVAFLRQKIKKETGGRGEEEVYDPLW